MDRTSLIDQRDDGRRKNLEVAAFDPVTRQVTLALRLTPAKLRTLTSEGRSGAILELHNSVRQVLANPNAIFVGLEALIEEPTGETSIYRDKSEWRYYVGIPSHSYDADGRQTPWRSQYLLLIEVDDEDVITRWWREKAGPSDKLMPADHADRFSFLLHQKT